MLVPLGRTLEVGPAETVPTLAYGLVLASFFAATRSPYAVGPVRVRRGGGTVEAWRRRPTRGRTRRRGEVVMAGDPEAVVDASSGRGPLSPPSPARRQRLSEWAVWPGTSPRAADKW